MSGLATLPSPSCPEGRPAAAETKLLTAIHATQRALATDEPDVRGGYPLQRVMALVAQRAQQLTGADGAGLELVEAGDLVFRVAVGSAAGMVGERRPVPPDVAGGRVGSVGSGSASGLLPGPFAGQAWCLDGAGDPLCASRAAACVPLFHHGRLVGLFTLFCARPERFGPGQLRALEVMAGLVTAAMSHAADFEAKHALLVERKLAVAMLQESEERFKNAFQFSPVGMALVAPNGSLLRVNQSLCEMLGFQQHELLATSLPAITFPPDCDLEHDLHAEMLRGDARTYQVEKRYFHRRGYLVWALLSVSVVRDQHGDPVQFIHQIQDITAWKRAEESLALRAQDLARSNAELEQFAYVASHDLQEPLRKVQAFGDRLQAGWSETLGEDGKDYLERMQSAARRMSTLINDLLTFSRVTTKAQPFEPVDLAVVAREVLSDLEVRVEQTGGRVAIGPLPTIDADRLQMRQLLQNLVANALKFHGEAPPVVRLEAEVAAEPGGGREICELRVSDNGIGFDEKYLDRIFGIFQRLHGRGQYEGTGVGLALCRKIAERHGGNITARSAPDEGATFIVRLPARQGVPVRAGGRAGSGSEETP